MNPRSSQFIEPKTKEELVYEQLKELILRGEIPAKEFLSQRTLASKVNAAVITVRAALRQLENDGLVENVPRWGVRLPEETRETLTDRYYMRRLFECEAAGQIVRKRQSIDSSGLLKLARECDRIDLDPEGSAEEFGSVHYRLHREIVALAGSPLMSRMFERINLKNLFFWNAYHTWQGIDSRHLGDHEKFINGLFGLALDDAVAMVVAHIERGLSFEIKGIEDTENRNK